MLITSLDSSNLSDQYIRDNATHRDVLVAVAQIKDALVGMKDERLADPDYEPDSYIASVDIAPDGSTAYICELFRNSAGGYGGSRSVESHCYYTAETDEEKSTLATLKS